MDIILSLNSGTKTFGASLATETSTVFSSASQAVTSIERGEICMLGSGGKAGIGNNAKKEKDKGTSFGKHTHNMSIKFLV